MLKCNDNGEGIPGWLPITAMRQNCVETEKIRIKCGDYDGDGAVEPYPKLVVVTEYTIRELRKSEEGMKIDFVIQSIP